MPPPLQLQDEPRVVEMEFGDRCYAALYVIVDDTITVRGPRATVTAPRDRWPAGAQALMLLREMVGAGRVDAVPCVRR